MTRISYELDGMPTPTIPGFRVTFPPAVTLESSRWNDLLPGNLPSIWQADADLLFWDFQLSVGDSIGNITRSSAIDRATNRLQEISLKFQKYDEIVFYNYHAGSQNFLNGSDKVSGLRPGPHDSSNWDDLIKSNVAIVLDYRKQIINHCNMPD